ncbi:MAG: hypothetical protein ACYC2I_02265 [Elusimicrobiales bacterium]
MKKTLLALLALLAAAPAAAATIRIVAPYTGSITNKYANSAYHLDLKDTAEMHGVYAQWINTEKFQANAFAYTAPAVNFSKVKGLHLNADYYFRPAPAGKWVAGAGLETLGIDMSAGNRIAGLTSFDMDNTVTFWFARAGRYFYYKNGPADLSLLPYAGWARETVTGDIALNPAGPAPLTRIDIDDRDDHALAGLNLNATLWHFIDLQGKWMGRFKDGDRLDEYSLMANFYLNRRWGLSYRYKYMEYGSSSNGYHLGGVAYCF